MPFFVWTNIHHFNQPLGRQTFLLTLRFIYEISRKSLVLSKTFVSLNDYRRRLTLEVSNSRVIRTNFHLMCVTPFHYPEHIHGLTSFVLWGCAVDNRDCCWRRIPSHLIHFSTSFILEGVRILLVNFLRALCLKHSF